MSVCAIEPAFFRALLEALGIEEIKVADQWDTESWRRHESILAAAFEQKTRDEWEELLTGSEACAAPVLSLAEAPRHEHNATRGTFVEIDGIEQPGPAPRFSRTPSGIAHGPEEPGARQHAALSAWGLTEAEIRLLV